MNNVIKRLKKRVRASMTSASMTSASMALTLILLYTFTDIHSQ